MLLSSRPQRSHCANCTTVVVCTCTIIVSLLCTYIQYNTIHALRTTRSVPQQHGHKLCRTYIRTCTSSVSALQYNTIPTIPTYIHPYVRHTYDTIHPTNFAALIYTNKNETTHYHYHHLCDETLALL